MTSVSTNTHGTLIPAGLTLFPADMCSVSSKLLPLSPDFLFAYFASTVSNRCLSTLSPRTCPLCRRPFHLTRACKLHVDIADSEHGYYVLSPTEIEARNLEEQIAHVSREDATDDECRSVIEQSIGWLEGAPSDSVSSQKIFLSTPTLNLSSTVQRITGFCLFVAPLQDCARKPYHGSD